ncbi:MAG: HEPN domain-containing protein [Phycisphaerae bacterium]|nr:HEPN domain-containing protein [Phycisphaerae bacterium]
MSRLNPQAETSGWLRCAREDLHAAESCLSQSGATLRHVCFFAQQAAEKAIKAGLTLLQIAFPKTHVLDALRNMLAEDWATRRECPDLADLTEWAVESRYPGDWPEATASEAADAVAKARLVVEAIDRDLVRHGFRRPAEPEN